jgi:hypothetical protein
MQNFFHKILKDFSLCIIAEVKILSYCSEGQPCNTCAVRTTPAGQPSVCRAISRIRPDDNHQKQLLHALFRSGPPTAKVPHIARQRLNYIRALHRQHCRGFFASAGQNRAQPGASFPLSEQKKNRNQAVFLAQGIPSYMALRKAWNRVTIIKNRIFSQQKFNGAGEKSCLAITCRGRYTTSLLAIKSSAL